MTESDFDAHYKADVYKFVRGQSIDSRIRAMILDLVNQALRSQRVVLSNPEKERLTSAILKDVLEAMLYELDH